jgi:hypothetical protein
MPRQARDRVARLYALKVSKRTVAREWLIFLPLLVLGGVLSFIVAYYYGGYGSYGGGLELPCMKQKAATR